VDQSRVECRDHLLFDYLKATDLNDLFAILDHYRIGCVLINTGSGIAYLLQHSPGWKMEYQDAVTVLMVRTAATGTQTETH
jgi:hypothetical protein